MLDIRKEEIELDLLDYLYSNNTITLNEYHIGILEKNYMFGVDSYVDKFNKKYNVNIDKATYCRFEGIQRLKTTKRLLILEVVYFLFEIKDLKMIIIMMVTYLIIDLILYNVRRKKFIKEVKAHI